MRQSYVFLLRIRRKLHSLTIISAKFACKRCKTLRRLRLCTERVRRRYGAGLVLIEELINKTHSLILLLVYDLGINLGSGKVSVPQQLAYCVDVST